MTTLQSRLYSWWEPVAIGLSKLPSFSLVLYKIFYRTCRLLLNVTSSFLELLRNMTYFLLGVTLSCLQLLGISWCLKQCQLCVVAVILYVVKHPLDYVVGSSRVILEHHGKRTLERRTQESMDKDVAQEVVERFVAESDGLYVGLKRLPDIGSRLQKYWFRSCRRGSDNVEVIISVTRVSSNCPVDLETDMFTITSKLFPDIKGLHIQPILDVRSFPVEQQLVVVQPFHPQGSLKDFIYDKSPVHDWSHKYCKFTTSPPPPHIVAKYGRQILEAMLYLYDRGFHQIGHVQAGNIFLEGECCLLGGFDNCVFGYKTRLVSLLSGNMDSMDLLMFGHLVFEMACGYELTTLVPTAEDWQRVDDSALLDALYLIFGRDHRERFTATLDKVLRHKFFQTKGSDTRAWRKLHSTHAAIDRDVKALLTKIKKGNSQPRKSKSDSNCNVL